MGHFVGLVANLPLKLLFEAQLLLLLGLDLRPARVIVIVVELAAGPRFCTVSVAIERLASSSLGMPFRRDARR